MMVGCGCIICWAPNQITYFINFFGYPVDWAGPWYHFTVVLVSTNSCINPFIYAAKYREFQRAVKRLFCKENAVGGST